MKFIRWTLWSLLILLLLLGLAVWLLTKPVASSRPVDQAAQTRYPLVLVHGMMGFDKVGPVSYWHGITERLQSHGANVWVMQVSAFNSSEVRGQQLLAALEQRMKAEGVSKVNLIGHSHGSHTSRYVAGVRPDLVASVTAVGGPNKGSAMADWIDSVDKKHPSVMGVVSSMANGLGQLINWGSGAQLPQDARATLGSLTSQGAAAFNQRFPAGVPVDACGEGAPEANGIRFYSWSGVGSFYHALNPADYLMALTAISFPDGDDNDGLVGKCSSHLGEVIRDDYPMNHFHEVNQVLGLVGWQVDPVQLYVDHAARLKAAGL